MISYLMHKDEVFAKLDIDSYGIRVLEFYTNRFPCTAEHIFHKWVSNRQTPYSAGNIADAYKFCGINDYLDFYKRTAFTSINDCFWIKTNEGQSWGSINLYTNSFTRALEDILMNGFKQQVNQLAIYSPSFTNGGSFPKIFRHKNNKIFCIKGSKLQKNKELDNWFVYSEVLLSQLYNYIGLVPFVSYKLNKYKDSIVCISEVFSSESTEYYPAVYYLSGYPCYETIKSLFSSYESFYIMLLIDCITFNKDRHTGNYGYLVDSDTGNIVNMCPVYDNNYALFPDLSIRNISKTNWGSLNTLVRSRLNNERFDDLAIKVLRDYPNGVNVLNKILSFNFKCEGSMQFWRVKRLNSIVHAQCRHILRRYEEEVL